MAKQIRVPKILGGTTLATLAAITTGVVLAWITAAAFPFQKQING